MEQITYNRVCELYNEFINENNISIHMWRSLHISQEDVDGENVNIYMPLLWWISYQTDEPMCEVPEQYRNARLIAQWIEIRLEQPIPNELKYKGWQTDIYESTPLIQWICTRENEPIQDDLITEEAIRMKDDEGYIPLVHWLFYHPDEPILESLLYKGAGREKDNEGCTPLMFWVNQHKYDENFEIPRSLKYPGWRQDCNMFNGTALHAFMHDDEESSINAPMRDCEIPTDFIFDSDDDEMM